MRTPFILTFPHALLPPRSYNYLLVLINDVEGQNIVRPNKLPIFAKAALSQF